MKLNKTQVDFNKLNVFCQVVESGNYQRASEHLGVTPSALSQTVTGLEAAMGFQLFDRIGKKLIPTAKGLKLHSEFRTHQSGFLRALHGITGKSVEVNGILRVGAYLEFAKTRLPGVLSEFLRDFPQAQIKMVFDSPTRLQELLAKGQLDLRFSIFPATGIKRILSVPISEEELVLVAHRNLFAESPTFDQLMSTPMIEYYFNHQPLQKWIYLHFQRRPKKLPIRAFAATAEMVLSLVQEGAGIGVVPLYLVNTPAMQKSVRILRPTSKRFTDNIWLLQRSGADRSDVHRAFVQSFHSLKN